VWRVKKVLTQGSTQFEIEIKIEIEINLVIIQWYTLNIHMS
jgi:hypothetical protein